jgi:uncharacterized protein (TIGR03067 family)
MKHHLPWITVAAALLAADNPKQEDANADLEKLQGTWQIARMEREGERAPNIASGRLRMMFKGNQYAYLEGNKVLDHGTITLDPSKTPKALDNKPESPIHKGETIPGIYRFDGDELDLCFAPAGKERPTEFKTKPGTKQFRYVLRREAK